MRVAMTEHLRQQIHSNARCALSAPINVHQEAFEAACKGLITAAVANTTQTETKHLAWRDHIALVDVPIPKEWCRVFQRVYFRVRIDPNALYADPELPVIDFSTPVSFRTVPVAPGCEVLDELICPPIQKYNFKVLLDVDITALDPDLVAAVVQAKVQAQAAESARYNTLYELRQLTYAYPSVNTMLKAYPQLAAFVPNHVMDKVNAPNEPRQPKPKPKTPAEKPTLDVNTLTTALAVHELTR